MIYLFGAFIAAVLVILGVEWYLRRSDKRGRSAGELADDAEKLAREKRYGI